MQSGKGVWTSMMVVILASCGGQEALSGDGPGGDVLVPDQGAADPGIRDEPSPRDAGNEPGAPDLPEVAADEGLVEPDPGLPDLQQPDPGPPDVGVSDPGFHPDAVPYGRCTTDPECPEGLVCDWPYPDAKHGFCSRECNVDTECPTPTLPIPWGCHKEPGALMGWCTSLCGVHAGGSTTCEEWLQCVASQWCLPPSTTVPTKGPGEACSGGAECLSGECVEGQNTRAHCALKCSSNEDCAGPEGQWKGSCITAAGLPYHFCLWQCGLMGGGATCPGSLQCVGMSVCQ